VLIENESVGEEEVDVKSDGDVVYMGSRKAG
jgi:hypothetical protein